MKLLVLTAPGSVAAEAETIGSLFDAGLEILHFRKPGWPAERLMKVLDMIDPDQHPKIMVHAHHELLNKYQLRGVHLPSCSIAPCGAKPGHSCSRSCHSTQEAENLAGNYEYLFISPVFDSVSKKGYLSAISIDELRDCTNRSGKRLVALGGITPETLPRLSTKVCWGAAVLGSVWQHQAVVERVQAFRELKAIADRL